MKSNLDFFIKKESVICRVLNYIVNNIEHDISHDDLARVSGYNKFYFNRFFYSKLQMTPMKWLWNYRLAQAFLKITSKPNQSINSIALSCGFSTASALNRAYKRRFGISPTQTRQGYSVNKAALNEVFRNLVCIQEKH